MLSLRRTKNLMDLVNQILINKYKIPYPFISLRKGLTVFLFFLIMIQSGCVQINLSNTEDFPLGSSSLGKYQKIHKISGSILLKPWSKTQESWIAGGGEYFVLDVGGADIVEYSANEGVIIRFEKDVIEDHFKSLVGKKVELIGNFMPNKPTKVDPFSQYPVDVHGDPLPSGAGFNVHSFRLLNN